MKIAHPKISVPVCSVLFLGLTGCTVAVQAPTDPITINLNVKIDQEVRVRLSDEVDELITENPDLFGTGAEPE
ncbi:MAG: YnbE family lipoprotein [Pseudomonadota bacterium]